MEGFDEVDDVDDDLDVEADTDSEVDGALIVVWGEGETVIVRKRDEVIKRLPTVPAPRTDFLV